MCPSRRVKVRDVPRLGTLSRIANALNALRDMLICQSYETVEIHLSTVETPAESAICSAGSIAARVICK